MLESRALPIRYWQKHLRGLCLERFRFLHFIKLKIRLLTNSVKPLHHRAPTYTIVNRHNIEEYKMGSLQFSLKTTALIQILGGGTIDGVERTDQLGPFCVKFACFPCTCLVSLYRYIGLSHFLDFLDHSCTAACLFLFWCLTLLPTFPSSHTPH